MKAAGKRRPHGTADAERRKGRPPMNVQLQLVLSRDRAQALRAEAQRDRDARLARSARPGGRPLAALLGALHLRPRVRPA